MQIDVVIEIPKGSRNKYEANEDGTVWLDRTLFTATHYPHDYGHVHHTLALDGDAIDAMVLLDEPTFPGCHIHTRPVGVFEMTDEAGVDEKLLCVPDGDPRFEQIKDISDVPKHLLDEIAHFFTVYKALEPGKHVEPGGWLGRQEAEAMYEAAVRRYEENQAH